MKYLATILLIITCYLPAFSQALPCEGYDLLSDEMFYRGSGSGVDADSLIARNKAMMIARQRIITQVEANVKSTTEIYIQIIATDTDAQTISYLQSLSLVVSKKLLVGSRVACEQTKQRQDHKYESSVAVEVATSSIMTLLPTDDKYQIDWDKYTEILYAQIHK